MMEPLHRFGVVVNRKKAGTEEALDRLRAAVSEADAEIIFETETGADDPLRKLRLDDPPDAVISLGGDGTFLYSARLLGRLGVPLLGINLGRLGFLTELGAHEVDLALRNLTSGHYRLEERLALRVQAMAGRRLLWRHEGLNEATISGSKPGRVAEIRITIDGELLTVYRADGVIVSTPTGSTAHSLSAGGPVVDPSMNALILNAICPHTLAVRPMVIADGRTLVIKAGPRNSGMLTVTVDGQEPESIDATARIELMRAPYHVKVVRVTNRSFYSVLRRKLGWRGSAPTGSK
jgi:NAD+ kinase